MFYTVRNAPNDGKEITLLIHGEILLELHFEEYKQPFKSSKILGIWLKLIYFGLKLNERADL